MPPESNASSELFDEVGHDVALGAGAAVLGGFARACSAELLAAVQVVSGVSAFRCMTVPGGRQMSVAMTNCGEVGWVSDRHGYRYDRIDPETAAAWPTMPPVFRALAVRAAEVAGFPGFAPDACLVNRYEPGARLALHQDRDERDFAAPIVSVSLGLPATFLWGGDARAVRPRRLRLVHGDVVVWGGPARLTFHGVDPLRDGSHRDTGRTRYNLTFRKAR